MIRSFAMLGLLLLITGALIRCSWGAECRITWDAQDAKFFRVWRGLELLAEVETNEATVTLPDDQPSVLTVTAHNDHGSSPHSAPLPVVAVRIQESSNLRTWWIVRTIHREKRQAMFYRLEILP
jgi:hypothetical protein